MYTHHTIIKCIWFEGFNGCECFSSEVVPRSFVFLSWRFRTDLALPTSGEGIELIVKMAREGCWRWKPPQKKLGISLK